MALKPAIELILKVGFTSVCKDFLKMSKGNSVLIEYKLYPLCLM